MKHLSALVLIIIAVGLTFHVRGAQSSTQAAQASSANGPTFEVASIKPNKSGIGPIGSVGDRFSNGQFRTTNIPLRILMRQAFRRMQDDDIVGGPKWMDTERWDIVAKAESPTADMFPMLRQMLIDRFKLVTHHETRERPFYGLVLAGRDRRLGPSLHPSTGAPQNRQEIGRFIAHNESLALLADVLAATVRLRVVDRTNLEGTYDIDLHWAPFAATAGVDAQPPSDGPSIFTAVQEQLGLKLESTKGPVDVLVIDHVEHPTPD